MQSSGFPFQNYDWDKREFLGEGGFAMVYKVKNTKTGETVAVKQMRMSQFDEDYKLEALKNQITSMKQCKSPFTVSLHQSDIGKTFAYIIMELCDENLKQYQSKKLVFDQKQVASIVSDIVSGYMEILYKGYIHRDLKPRNILKKGKFFKITDFGFAIKITDKKLMENCGTPIYMAPQLLHGKPYGSKCDVWSLGMIMYELLFGTQPWATRYIETYKKDVVSREVSFPYDFKIGENTKNLIQRCLQLEEDDRISWKQIAEHPFVKNRNPGKPVVCHQVDIKNQQILARIQKSSAENFVNPKRLFAQLQKSNQIMDEKLFYQFLLKLDEQITTYESSQMFKIADFQKNHKIHMDEFRKFFLEVDYRPAYDVASKLIDQIVIIAKTKQIDTKQFFHLFDLNKSQQIQYGQFIKCIRQIAPRFGEKQIDLIWKKFDADKSGGVSIQQFFSKVAFGMTQHPKVDFKYIDRATRNIDCLREVAKSRGTTPQSLFAKKKDPTTKSMTLEEFGLLIRGVNYVISRDEIVEMFRLIDVNNSDTIEISELYRLLNK